MPHPRPLLLLAIFLSTIGCSNKRSRSLELTRAGQDELKQKHYGAAQSDFEQAVALNPENQVARDYLASAREEQRKAEDALRAANAPPARLPPDVGHDGTEDDARKAALDALHQALGADQSSKLGGDVADHGAAPRRTSGRVDASKPQVRGRLDGEIVRRIVQRHINEVRFCYEKELMRKPDLAGEVDVAFTIAADGQVAAAVVKRSTLGDDATATCIAGAVRRWEFPKPQGGIVVVTYPFVLKAADGR